MWNRYVFTGDKIVIAPTRDKAREYFKARGFKGSYLTKQSNVIALLQDSHTVYIYRATKA